MSIGINKLFQEVKTLPLLGKVALLVGIFILISLIGWGAHRIGQSSSYSKHKKQQEQSLKESQDALAKAEAAEARAEAKELEADKLGAVNTSKANDLDRKRGSIETEDATRQKEIEQNAQRDKDFINSNLDTCDRCLDVRARQTRLGLTPRDCQSECATDEDQ